MPSTIYKVTVVSALFCEDDRETFHLSYPPSPRDVIELLQAKSEAASDDDELDEEGQEDAVELLDCLTAVVKHGPKKLIAKDGEETKYPVVIAGIDIGTIRIESFPVHSRKR